MEQELKDLKEMLVKGFEQMRERKQKNTPAHGVFVYLLGCIIQCNKVLNKLPNRTQSKNNQLTNYQSDSNPGTRRKKLRLVFLLSYAITTYVVYATRITRIAPHYNRGTKHNLNAKKFAPPLPPFINRGPTTSGCIAWFRESMLVKTF